MVIDHERWYSKYLLKHKGNKEAINSWKAERVGTIIVTPPVVTSVAKTKKVTEVDLQNIILKKSQIIQWRAEKNKIIENELESKVWKPEPIKLRKRRKSRKATSDLDIARPRSVPSSNKVVMAKQKEREAQVFQKRIEWKRKLNLELAEKEIRLRMLKGSSPKTRGDPFGYLKPTKISVLKNFDPNIKKENSPQGFFISNQRLGTPLWRQGTL